MASPKITGFIIALILVSLSAAVFGNFFGGLNLNYQNTEYDNETFDSINKLTELVNDTEEIRDETENIQEKEQVTDIIGGYFSAAYKAMKLTSKTFDVFLDMTLGSIAEKTGIPMIGLFISSLISIVLIIIFVGVIISALVKRDL